MENKNGFDNNDFEQVLNKTCDGNYKPEAFILENDWRAPIPFPKYTLKEFPVECMPDWLKNYVIKVSDSTQTELDIAGAFSLGALSTVCAKKWRVKVNDDWYENLNLYLTIVADSGERKSPVFKALTHVINEYESKKKGSRLLVDDITPEKLSVLLQLYDGIMSILSSEGGVFDKITGLYNKKVNDDVFLKAYDGETIRVDRIGRESIRVENPILTIAVMTQPVILNEVMNKHRLRNKGLLPRFLFVMAQSRIGSRKIENEPIPAQVREEYEANLIKLLETPIPDKPIEIMLSPEAKLISNEFASQLEPRLIEDLVDIKLWALKLHGNVLRIAGLLHIAKFICCDDRQIGVIDAKTMGDAIELGDYFMHHARPAFDQMYSDYRISDARYIINWLKKMGSPIVNQRDINRGTRGRIKYVKDLLPVLEILEDHEYLRSMSAIPTKTGRPPSIQYEVNPYIML